MGGIKSGIGLGVMLAGSVLLLTGCFDPPAGDGGGEAPADAQGAPAAADPAARAACYEAAGFTVAETSPAPAGGGYRRGPGGDAWNEGALQAADGTWMDIYAWSEWVNNPTHAPAAAAYQVEAFNEQGYDGYGQARAVGRRALVPHGAAAAPENAALDACLMMP